MSGVNHALRLVLALAMGLPASGWTQDDPGIRGTTRCAADLQLSFAVTGRLAKTHVVEGSVVEQGELLMELDRAAEELDLQRRKVQWEGKADLLAAQARKETAEKQLEAARTIFEANRGISLEELQNRELAYVTTLAELERVKTLKETEWLDYLTAKENLERRSMRSPNRGIVVKLIKQTGESAQANEAALRLCDLSRIVFVANIPIERAENLQTGRTVSVRVGQKAVPVRGRITFVSPIVDAASGLREVKIDLINPPASVRPGVMAVLVL